MDDPSTQFRFETFTSKTSLFMHIYVTYKTLKSITVSINHTLDFLQRYTLIPILEAILNIQVQHDITCKSGKS